MIGLSTRENYPYVAHQQSCKQLASFFKISSYKIISVNDCDGLDKALTKQPISVAVDAENFHLYHSGVFSQCGTRLNYGGLLVGATSAYYTLKLSWGYNFGEAGYIRLERRSDICGICQLASYPIF